MDSNNTSFSDAQAEFREQRADKDTYARAFVESKGREGELEAAYIAIRVSKNARRIAVNNFRAGVYRMYGAILVGVAFAVLGAGRYPAFSQTPAVILILPITICVCFVAHRLYGRGEKITPPSLPLFVRVFLFILYLSVGAAMCNSVIGLWIAFFRAPQPDPYVEPTIYPVYSPEKRAGALTQEDLDAMLRTLREDSQKKNPVR